MACRLSLDHSFVTSACRPYGAPLLNSQRIDGIEEGDGSVPTEKVDATLWNLHLQAWLGLIHLLSAVARALFGVRRLWSIALDELSSLGWLLFRS